MWQVAAKLTDRIGQQDIRGYISTRPFFVAEYRTIIGRLEATLEEPARCII